MRTIATISAVCLGLFVVGGAAAEKNKTSILEAIGDEALMEAAAKSAGASLTGQGGGKSDSDIDYSFSLKGADGKQTALLTAYRDQIVKAIEAAGGTVRGFGFSQSGNDLRAFKLRYIADSRNGLVRVHVEQQPSERLKLYLFCYEHDVVGGEKGK